MQEKLFKWLPFAYLLISFMWNLFLLHRHRLNYFDYQDAEDMLYGIVLAGLLVFIPAVILFFILVKGKENLKYSMFASMWLWAISSYLFYGALQADRPCMAG